MSNRETLHRLMDTLPEASLENVERVLRRPYNIVASPDLLENVNGLPRLKPEVLKALESTNPELTKQLVHTQKEFEDRMNLPERMDAKQKEFAEKYPELWQRWSQREPSMHRDLVVSTWFYVWTIGTEDDPRKHLYERFVVNIMKRALGESDFI